MKLMQVMRLSQPLPQLIMRGSLELHDIVGACKRTDFEEDCVHAVALEAAVEAWRARGDRQFAVDGTQRVLIHSEPSDGHRQREL